MPEFGKHLFSGPTVGGFAFGLVLIEPPIEFSPFLVGHGEGIQVRVGGNALPKHLRKPRPFSRRQREQLGDVDVHAANLRRRRAGGKPANQVEISRFPLFDSEAMRKVVISRGQDGHWVAECPSLPGCVSQGCTRDEAIDNIKEAIEAYIAALRDDGRRVPQDTLDTTVIGV